MYILGINAYHGDAAAALIRDGRIIAAVEEERFDRTKHCVGFPTESIPYRYVCEHIDNPKRHLG
jgi:carbamoyltransferase